MTKNIFVVGMDSFNEQILKRWERNLDVTFHSLLGLSEVKAKGEYPVMKMLKEAEDRLASFESSVDGIISFWDFPVTLLASILASRFQLAGPELDAVLRCEHKYWSRLEQSRVLDDVPEFYAVDPFSDQAKAGISLAYPYWLKPIKSCGSFLAFHVRTEEDLDHALAKLRKNLGKIGQQFNQVLDMARLPQEVAEVDGMHCLAEEEIGGHQCTTEGFVHNGRVTVYAVIDSERYPERSSFLCYKYPSTLPDQIQQRMITATKKVMKQIDYDNGMFNVEFFYDNAKDKLSILEINPRHSQSHALMLEHVDGIPNHRMAAQLALGEKPEVRFREGRFHFGAKFYIRHFSDGMIEDIPTADDIACVQEEFPDATVDINVKPGSKLSELFEQDSYSFALADIHLGADTESELLSKFQRCRELLPFHIKDISHKRALPDEIRRQLSV